MSLIDRIASTLGLRQEAAPAAAPGLQEAAQLAATVGFLQERMAELEFALEDAEGWRRLGGESDRELSREALRRINALARVMWLKNPLIKRGVAIQTQYVWAQGCTIQAPDPAVNEAIQAFLDDPKNKPVLGSQQARAQLETELQIEANLFFAFFVNPRTGRVRVRTIPFAEVVERRCNPQDAQEPWYYKRRWSERREGGGSITQEAWYPDWRHRPAEGHPAVIDKVPVVQVPVYHVAVNKLADMAFGVSELYAPCDWARAYKEFLENWATIVRAYSRFAFNLTTSGGASGVAAAKARLNTGLGGAGASRDSNPAPVAGSTFIATEGVKLDPVKTAGATTSAEDGRRLLLMVCAGLGIYEHYMGDPSTGNLATATSMERPMELMFLDRQSLWASVLQDICLFVVEARARARAQGLAGLGRDVVDTDDGEIAWTWAGERPRVEVGFPSLLDHALAEKVEAVVLAATLDGKAAAGTLEEKAVTRLLLTALGERDLDEVLDRMYPDGTGEGPQEADEDPEPDPEDEVPADKAIQEAARRLREGLP